MNPDPPPGERAPKTDAPAAIPPPESTAEKRPDRPPATGIRRNAMAQMFGRLVYLASRVVLPPITLHFVSLEEYGLWSTCFLIIGYIGIGTFGVANVYTRFTAQYHARAQNREIGQLLAVGLTITLIFSAVVLAALHAGMPWLLDSFQVAPPLRETASVLILGSVATMLLDMTFGAFAYVLQGLNRIVQQTVVWVLSFLLETVVMVTLLMQGFGVRGLLLAFVARYLFSTIAYMVLCWRAVPGLRLQLRGVGRETYRLFLGYGSVLQISGLLSIFLYSFERLAAGNLAGVAAVGLLDIGQKFPMMASQLFSSAQNSFLTTLTQLHTQNRRAEMAEVLIRGTRYLNLLNGLAMGFMAPFGSLLIMAWVGPDKAYPQGAMVLALAAIGYHFHAITGPATTYFQGLQRPWQPFLTLLLPQLLLAALGLLLMLELQEDRLLAVAASMAAARILSSLIFQARTNLDLGYGQWRYLWRVLLPGVMPYVLGYGMQYTLQEWLAGRATGRLELLALLATLGCGYLLLNAVLFLLLFADRQERHSIFRKLGRAR